MSENVPHSAVRRFLEDHFHHFNARETVAAARGYRRHIAGGGKMMVTLAGAMSTAQIGRSLAPMIRGGLVHAITCTAANLEEDIFALVAGDQYETIENWRALSVEDEAQLLARGMNRVTDTCIPETVMRDIEGRLTAAWIDAAGQRRRRLPADFMFDLVRDGLSEVDGGIDPNRWDRSWIVAASENDIPVFTPGFEDSTLGNIYAARVIEGVVPNHDAVCTGTEQMQRLAKWYEGQTDHGVGFFQIGGGIAGDFPICVVPMLNQDLQRGVPLWAYFCQISDAVTSYGGYSGAVPNEKITWGKLAPDTPKFMIQSDASIVAPLIFAHVLGW